MSKARSTGNIGNIIKTSATCVTVSDGTTDLLIMSGSGKVTIPGNLVVLGGIAGSSAESASYSLTSSFATNANFLDGIDGASFLQTGSFNTFSSSIDTTIKNKLNNDGVVSGSVQVTLTGTTGYSTFSSSLSSSIGSLSGSVATTTSNLSSSIGSLSSSVATTTSGLSGRITTIEGRYATTGSNTFVGSQIITGSLYITNDMIVQGCSCLQNITASVVSIGTNTVVLNTATPAVRFAGISVQDSGSNAGVTGSIFWDGLCNKWVYSNPSGIGYSGGMLLSGPRTSTLGSEAPLTCNYIAKSGGGDHLYDSVIYENSGNIAIGSTTADEKLEVVGGNITIPNGNFYRGRFNGGTPQDLIGMSSGNVIRVGDFTNSWNTELGSAACIKFLIANAEKVRINHCGNVGIGATSITNKLDICGGDVGLDNAKWLRWKFCDGDYQDTMTYSNCNDIVFQGGNGILFRTNTLYSTCDRMIISCAGCVGIGTNSPSATFEVIGNSAIQGEVRIKRSGTQYGTLYTSSGLDLFLESANSAAIYFNSNASVHTWRNNGTNAMSLNSTGLGIGTISPTSALNVQGTSSCTLLTITNCYAATGGTDYCGTSGIIFQQFGSYLGATIRNGGKILSVRECNYSENGLANSSLEFYTTCGNTDVSRFRINSSGDACFRGKVGISGDAAASNFALTINGCTIVYGQNDFVFNQPNGYTNGIVWKNGAYTKDSASIRPISTSAWAVQGLGFYTGNYGNNTSNPDLRFAISPDGNSYFNCPVGINIAVPSAILDVRAYAVNNCLATLRIGTQCNGGSGDEFANLEFYWGDPDAAEVKAKIFTKNTGNVGPGGGGAASLIFATRTANAGLCNRFSIDSDGVSSFCCSVGIGTAPTQSGTKLQVAGVTDIWSSSNTLLRLNHDGTKGIVETYTGGAYSNTVINPGGGNVGIGTASPQSIFHIIKGLGNDVINIGESGTNTRFAIGQEASYTGNYINSRNIDLKLQAYCAGGSGGNIHLQTGTDGTGCVTTKMFLCSTGNVGINTLSPGARLEVKANDSYGNGTQGNIKLTNAGYRNDDLSSYGEGGYLDFYFENYNDSYGGTVYDRVLDIVVKGSPDGTYGKGVIRFKANPKTTGSNSTEIMRIQGDNKVIVNGNVGIGCTSPGLSLTIGSTDALRLPTGTTAQRPTAVCSLLRFNSDLRLFEGAGADGWGALGIQESIVMNNYDPHIGTPGFLCITNNADGGGTTWTIRQSGIFGPTSTSGGHSGQWGPLVYMTPGAWRWRWTAIPTNCDGSIHGNTPASAYKCTIATEFNINGVSTGTIKYDTCIFKENMHIGGITSPVWISTAGCFTVSYSTNGYDGVRAVYFKELILEKLR